MNGIFKIDIDKSRIFGLDILRAFAILFVVIDHGKGLLPAKYNYIHRFIVFDGVSIFFVLSGFLIGGILIKLVDRNTLSLKLLSNFWIRRWFRTIPNYFLVLSFLMIYNIYFNNNFTPHKYLNYFYFSQNLFYKHPGFFPEAWSLSVEEWFYLITPALIFACIRIFKIKPKHSILIIVLLVITSVLIYRYLLFIKLDIDSYKFWGKMFRKQVFTRLDSLMFGVLCAFVKYYYNDIFYKYKENFFVLGIIIFLIFKCVSFFGYVAYDSFFHCVLSFVVVSISTSFLLPYLSSWKNGSGIIFKWITIISLISYSMYLINLSVVRLCLLEIIDIKSYFSNELLVIVLNYGLYWVITIFGSILIFKYFEIPATSLRDSRFVKQILKKM